VKRIQKYLTRSRLLTIGLVACIVLAANQLRGQNAKPDKDAQEGANVRDWMQPLLKDPDFIKIDWEQLKSWRADHGYVFLPPEKPEHPEGIFRVTGLMATTYKKIPFEGGVYARRTKLRVLNGQGRYLNVKQSEDIALQFLKKHFSWFFAEREIPQVGKSKIFSDGRIEFAMSRTDKEGFTSARASATIRVIDAKVIGASAITVTYRPKHKLSPSQAKKIALEVAKKDARMLNPEIVSFGLEEIEGGRSVYRIYVRAGYRGKDRLGGGPIAIDAMTGQHIPEESYFTTDFGEDIHGNLEKPTGKQPQVLDSLPIWSRDNLLFLSSRALSPMPAWAEYDLQLMLQGQDNNPHYLTSDLQTRFTDATAHPNSSWVTLSSHPYIYAFNTQTGAYKALTDGERTAGFAAVSTKGEWSVVSSNGQETRSTLDLFVDHLSARDKIFPILRTRLVLPGDQRQAVFSNDDEWLYFITVTSTGNQPKHVLQRISAALFPKQAAGPYRVDAKDVETIAENLPGEVKRLSLFPDGQRLLLQTNKGLQIVSIANGQVTPLVLNNLRDAERKDAVIKDIDFGWAGPGDDRVTFSGDSSPGEYSEPIRRIYSCRFDGSDLKAHTPRENEPVPMYKFPDSDKTAYDLAKEWALGEIKWEDEQKRRNQ